MNQGVHFMIHDNKFTHCSQNHIDLFIIPLFPKLTYANRYAMYNCKYTKHLLVSFPLFSILFLPLATIYQNLYSPKNKLYFYGSLQFKKYFCICFSFTFQNCPIK